MLIPIILSGGSGSRLWPASRALRPKPFLELPDGETLLQKSLMRASLLLKSQADSNLDAPIVVVTNQAFLFETRDTYAACGLSNPLHLLLEPIGRSTAPAIAMAAQYVRAHFGADATMLVLAADHLIEPFEAFSNTVKQAVSVSKSGKLATFGIEPLRPETGYGYIEADVREPIEHDNAKIAFAVSRFVEKPPLSKAEQFIRQGHYYWNSGMFCFSAGAVLETLEHTDNTLAKQVQSCWDKTNSTFSGKNAIQVEWSFDSDTFSACDNISIDYAVMEKASNVAVVPSNFGWNDIGAWDSFSDLINADANDNRVSTGKDGLVILDASSRNSFIQTNRLVATVGVQDLLIVDTPDALLIAHRNQAQNVKKITEQLKDMKHSAFELHNTVHRPWGTYTILEESALFKIKRIEVKPHAALSLQSHQYRSEHWIIVEGEAIVTNGNDVLTLKESESTFIVAGQKHRLENATEKNLVIIEVQTGSYLGEDDIERFDDQYGRLK